MHCQQYSQDNEEMKKKKVYRALLVIIIIAGLCVSVAVSRTCALNCAPFCLCSDVSGQKVRSEEKEEQQQLTDDDDGDYDGEQFVDREGSEKLWPVTRSCWWCHKCRKWNDTFRCVHVQVANCTRILQSTAETTCRSRRSDAN